MNYIFWIVCLFWIVCGIISFGLDFAYFQKKYPSAAKEDYKKDRIYCLFFSIAGPFNLIDAIIRKEYKYGLKYQ